MKMEYGGDLPEVTKKAWSVGAPCFFLLYRKLLKSAKMVYNKLEIKKA